LFIHLNAAQIGQVHQAANGKSLAEILQSPHEIISPCGLSDSELFFCYQACILAKLSDTKRKVGEMKTKLYDMRRKLEARETFIHRFCRLL
jgi:hypothetical protein